MNRSKSLLPITLLVASLTIPTIVAYALYVCSAWIDPAELRLHATILTALRR